MSTAMSIRSKCILMNAAVAAGLAYKLWKSAPIAVALATGLILFPLVNLILFFVSSKSTSLKRT